MIGCLSFLDEFTIFCPPITINDMVHCDKNRVFFVVLEIWQTFFFISCGQEMLVHKKFTIFFTLIKLVNFSDFYFNLSKCEIFLSNFFFFLVS